MRSSVASGRAVRVERSSQNSIFYFHFSFMLFLFWKETPQTHTLASLNPLWHPSLSCYFSYSLKKKSFLSPCPLSSFSQTTDGRGITSQTIYIISRSTTDPSYYVSLSLTLVCPYFDSVGHDGPLFFWGGRMSAALFFNDLFIDDLFWQYAISDKEEDDDGVTMETMNINSVSVVMDDSSTTFSVTQQQDNQLLLVSNRQSRDIIDSSNQHQPMKMVDPIEVFKQTVRVISFPISVHIFSCCFRPVITRAT